MIDAYVIEPHWANWLLVLEMFVAGVAAGTYFVAALANIAGGGGGIAEDREVAARLGFVPLPLMLVTAALLITDLGEPGRFLNLIFLSPFAEERGPGPLMLNVNSPMNWGTYAITLFGIFTFFAFMDALSHSGRLPRALRMGWGEALSHNPVWLGLGAFFALATGTYSGVLLNVTNQNVWGDTVLLGAMYMTFSALSGMAVAAIVADRQKATRTAGAVRSGLIAFAAISGVLLLLFVANLAAVGRATPLVATLGALVGPVFWIGAVGAAILFPIVILTRRPGLVVAGIAAGRLAVIGVVVLIGVLAFRYALLYSALAAVEG